MVIKQLIYLLALDHERHFGAAAERCHISQPTFSAAIRQLEEELGSPIVERGNRFLGFTEAGQVVLEHARRIVAECDALRQGLSELKRGLSGHLRLGVIPSALPMTALITMPFAEAHPGVEITILAMSSSDIQKGLDSFEIDAGITYLDNEPLNRVRTRPLYREHYVLLTPGDGPLAGRSTVTWTETATLRPIRLTPNMQNRRILDAVFRGLGHPVPTWIETDSMIAMVTHVQEGAGSAILPWAILRMLGTPPGTLALPLIEPAITHLIGLAIADRAPPPPLARAVFDRVDELDLAGQLERR